MKYLSPILVLVLFVGCSDNPAKPTPDGAWTHRYTAFDSMGAAIVSGYLHLTFTATDDALYPMQVSGSWELSALRPAEDIGMQVGEGDLVGSVRANGELWLDLNPDRVDANVTFRGPCADAECSHVEGQWVYSIIVGGMNAGDAIIKRL